MSAVASTHSVPGSQKLSSIERELLEDFRACVHQRLAQGEGAPSRKPPTNLPAADPSARNTAAVSGASHGARTQSRLQHQRVPCLLDGRCPAPQKNRAPCICQCAAAATRSGLRLPLPLQGAVPRNPQPVQCCGLFCVRLLVQKLAGTTLQKVKARLAPALRPWCRRKLVALLLPWCCGHARETTRAAQLPGANAAPAQPYWYTR